MTNVIRLLFAAFLVATALGATAQDSVRVEVPFDFHVGNQILPAGTYVVARLSDGNPRVLQIRAIKGSSTMLMVGSPSSEETGANLSFLRFGDSYYLTAVTNSLGKYNLPRKSIESMAASNGTGTHVSVGSN